VRLCLGVLRGSAMRWIALDLGQPANIGLEPIAA
jgi:hypothetical protein